jgi:glycerol-3-phosphate dehydrogenase (NAD(P)+)
MDIAVVGAGKWGEALSFAFAQNSKNSVVITSAQGSKKSIKNFVSLDEALKREFLVVAISAQYLREWMEKNFVDFNQKLLIASKGIEISSGNLLNEVLESFVDLKRVAFLSGPSFAKEVKESLPTALVVSSSDLDLAKSYAEALPEFIKGYVDEDVIGAEVGGAYKNVIAIAGGVCDGLKLGNNARASLISRGLVEMARFGMSLGAKESTFLSLGGAGDLFLSASSNLSRNYRVGFGLAKGMSLDEILEELGEVAEGVGTAKALFNIAKEKDIYLPIAKEVYLMLGGKSPKQSLRDLLDK